MNFRTFRKEFFSYPTSPFSWPKYENHISPLFYEMSNVRNILFKPQIQRDFSGFHDVFYKGTMPRLVQIETCFFWDNSLYIRIIYLLFISNSTDNDIIFYLRRSFSLGCIFSQAYNYGDNSAPSELGRGEGGGRGVEGL